MGAQAAAALTGGAVLGHVPSDAAPVTVLSLGPVPDGLALDRVARSHGWCALPPYGYDVTSRHLHRVLDVGGNPVPIRVDDDWTVHSATALTPPVGAAVREDLRWCLGLDDDVAGAPPGVQAMRMLRSPTVWEDLVKTLFTTNCSWAATVGMTTRLVETYSHAGSFPTPAAVVAAGESQLRERVRAGYRTSSLVSLARAVHDGELDPQAWRDPTCEDSDVLTGVLALAGFGRYAAEGMLGLLGRPRGLAVDSWVGAQLGGLTQADVRARYAPLGRWAGAQLWQDVTAGWFGG